MVFATGLVLLAACTDNSGPAENSSSKPKRAEHLVEVVSLQAQTYQYSTTHTGSLRARRTARLFNLEEGRVLKIGVFEGDKVRKGQVLVQLDDDLLKAELEKLEAKHKQADQDVKRLQELLTRKLGSRGELERAETELAIARGEENVLRTRLRQTSNKAPFTGIISERLVEAGDVVARHTHLLTLYDPSSLITEVRVSELLLPYLKVGDFAGVVIDALGDSRFEGKIVRIHPTVDAQSRRGTIEVELKPVPKGAMAGQLCRIFVNIERKDRLLLPFSALQRDLKSEYVLLVNEQGITERAAIQTGLRQGQNIEVVRGLSSGQRVVVRGMLGLSEGKPVKVVAR